MKTVLQELKELLQQKVNSPMSMQIECDIFQRVVDVIDEVYFEKEERQIKEAYKSGEIRKGEGANQYFECVFKRSN